jgi:hypothetical protein
VLEVLGKIDRSHASATDLLFDAVSLRDGGSQALRDRRHVISF